VADIDGIAIPRPAAAAAKQMVEAARSAGVRDGEPEALLYASMGASVTEIDESAARIEAIVAGLEARLNSTDQSAAERFERHLRLVAAASLKDAAKGIVASHRWRAAAIVAGVAVAAVTGGAWVGWESGYTTASQRTAWTAVELQAAFRGGLPGAEWLANVVTLNDLEGLAGSCREHQWSAVGGGKGCTVQVRVSASSVGEKH
jgi:hypothetical protein